MRPFLLAAALFAVALSAQSAPDPLRIRIGNESPSAQLRWCDVALPHALAGDVPELARVDPFGWLVVRGRDVGTHSTLVHVLAEIPGSSTADGWLARLTDPIPGRAVPDVSPFAMPPNDVAVPVPSLPFIESPAIRARAPSLIARLFVDGREIPRTLLEVVDSNAARQTWHARYVGRGFVGESWSYIYALQDVVPVTATIVWSDPSSPGFSTPATAVEWLWGDGVEVQGRFAAAEGWQASGSRITWTTPTGALGDAEVIPFRVELLVREPEGDVGPEGDPLAHLRERAELRLEASRGGPVRGVSRDWDGHWMVYGGTPQLPGARTAPPAEGVGVEPVPAVAAKAAEDEAHAFAQRLATAGSMYDRRPYGAPGRAANAGGQPVFGNALAGIAVSLCDPRQLDRIAFSVTDCALRPEHHRELDGTPLQARDHPHLCTWDRRPHKCGTDRLGKADWPPGFGVSNRTGRDDQHLCDWLAAYVALTGDDAAAQWLADGVQLDACQARVRQGTMGAQRAVGRVLRYEANAWLVLEDDDRAAAELVMRSRIRAVAEHWRGRSEGPVEALAPYVDPRGILDLDGTPVPSVNVTFEGFGFLGLHAASLVLGESDPDGAVAADIARQGILSWVQYLVYPDARTGVWTCPYQIRYLDGGEPLDQGMLWEGAKHLTHAGGSDWWIWSGGVVRVADRLVEAGPLRERVDAIMAGVIERGPRSWEEAHFWASVPGH